MEMMTPEDAVIPKSEPQHLMSTLEKAHQEQ
jgi:hypothetical protein